MKTDISYLESEEFFKYNLLENIIRGCLRSDFYIQRCIEKKLRKSIKNNENVEIINWYKFMIFEMEELIEIPPYFHQWSLT